MNDGHVNQMSKQQQKIIMSLFLRDAALMSFGSILEGPDATQLKPLVEQAMPMLIETMRDSSVVVQVRFKQ